MAACCVVRAALVAAFFMDFFLAILLRAGFLRIAFFATFFFAGFLRIAFFTTFFFAGFFREGFLRTVFLTERIGLRAFRFTAFFTLVFLDFLRVLRAIVPPVYSSWCVTRGILMEIIVRGNRYLHETEKSSRVWGAIDAKHLDVSIWSCHGMQHGHRSDNL